jgi:hypothetical protein
MESRLFSRLVSKVRGRLNEGYAIGFSENLLHRLSLLTCQQQRMTLLQGRLQRCTDHSFHLAREKILEELRWATGDLLNELSHFNDLLRQRPATLPGYREVWNDLKQLEVEFGSMQQEGWDLRVQTDPITLEDIELGAFQITLRLDCLHHRDLGSVLRAKAMEPNPASSDESITHPHVSGESICTGEATAPIHSALRQGRLCDVFLLVRSVLETYNSGSPYVSLEDWFGSRCSDCGDRVSADDRYSCSRCGDELCPNCAVLCAECDSAYCADHIRSCPGCERSLCSDCLSTCRACGRRFCLDCLSDEECPDCVQAKEKSHEEASESTSDDIAAA